MLDDFRYYSEWHDHANRRRYDAPADPWAVVRVDPAEVTRYASVDLRWGVGRVRGGDWDRPENCEDVTGTAMFEGLRRRFEEGRDWEETAYYERERERFEEVDQYRGYEDFDAYREERFPEVDDLFERMRSEGYRPNFERVYDDVAAVEYVHELEPLVGIGRSGEVIWSEGYHRLALARILGIDEIPVYVLRRHERWQRKRDAVANAPDGEVPPDLEAHADHPDLADVVGDRPDPSA